MRMISIQKWLTGSLALAGILAETAPTARAQTAPGPIFSTQTPALGIAGSVFSVSLPVVNTGGNAATNVQVTSVIFSGALTSPTLPISLGTMMIGATATLNLNFNDSTLTAGRAISADSARQLPIQRVHFGICSQPHYYLRRCDPISASSKSVERDYYH